MLAILLLERSERHVLNEHVQVVHLCERVAREDIEPDHSAMASLRSVQQSVPAAPVEFYLV